MNDVLGRSIVLLLVLAIFIGLPSVMIWGWVRWARFKVQRVGSILSFAGFVLANAAALLAVGTALYAHAIRGFPFYDSRLLKIYLLGLGLSFLGIVCALLGAVRPNVLRWHAPISSIGMFLLWLMMTATE
jgi:hypothetical protein